VEYIGEEVRLSNDQCKEDDMGMAGEVYKCEVCGQVVEVKEGGVGELVCCSQPMVKQ
jgi:desulfoferrodoxin-like iron-binding protein